MRSVADSLSVKFDARILQKYDFYPMDIGISLDENADRLILIDEKGHILDGDQIMAICALDMMERDALPGRQLVATVMSNMALEIFIKEHEGQLRWRRPATTCPQSTGDASGTRSSPRSSSPK